MRDRRVRSGGVPAAVVAGLMLLLASCTQTNQQATNSPEVSPSPTPVASPTPSTSPTPVESPSASPTPLASISPPAALIISSVPFHAGELGVGYAPVALGAQGGVPPYKWSIATGALPPGLALTSAGTASGKPTTTGSFTFVVRVDDSAGAAAGVPKTISVVPHLAVSGTCTKQCSVEEGCVTVCGRYGTQTGGVAPFKYQVIVGQIPTGMGIKGLNLTGAFTKAPQICECTPIWSYSVQVTDALGATDAVNAVYYVFPHIHIVGPGALCQGFGCTTTLFYNGGDGSNPTVDISNVVCTNGCSGANGEPAPNTLPAGFSATAGGGAITVTFPGGTWVGTLDIALADASPCGPFAFCQSNTVTQAADVNAG